MKTAGWLIDPIGRPDGRRDGITGGALPRAFSANSWLEHVRTLSAFFLLEQDSVALTEDTPEAFLLFQLGVREQTHKSSVFTVYLPVNLALRIKSRVRIVARTVFGESEREKALASFWSLVCMYCAVQCAMRLE